MELLTKQFFIIYNQKINGPILSLRAKLSYVFYNEIELCCVFCIQYVAILHFHSLESLSPPQPIRSVCGNNFPPITIYKLLVSYNFVKSQQITI